jgi:hypothetical protein
MDDLDELLNATMAALDSFGFNRAAETVARASTEIERLRAEVEALKAKLAEYSRANDRIVAELRECDREVEALRADAQAVAALLPGPYYMDPPDGGSVTVIEQLRRMAADAARYRWLRHHSTYTTVTPCIHGEVAGPSRMRWYHDSYQLQAFTLDAAIDAAIKSGLK